MWPLVYIAAVDRSIRRRRRGGAVYSGSLPLRRHSRHATHHDFKPLPPFPGVCLSSSPVQPGPPEHRDLRTSAPGCDGDLFALSSTGARLRSTPRAPLRIHSLLGISGLSALLHAARRLPPLRRRPLRRSSRGRRQTHAHQGLYALPSPLGTPPFLERSGASLPHLMGK